MGRARERDRQIVPTAETPHHHQEVSVGQKREQQQAGGRGWLVVDSEGQGTILDVDKHGIMQRFNIHARDFRVLDPHLSYPSAILVRDSAIILNLEHIKAIVTADEVLLRDPSDENVIPVVEELKRRLHNDDIGDDDNDESPFEFRALEVTLEAVCSFLAARTTELENAAYPALDELTLKVTSRNLDQVRKLKSAMTRLTTRVQKVRDEIEQLLDDDDDMADLCLSRKMATPPHSPSSRSIATNRPLNSPTSGTKTIQVSKASVMGIHGEENGVEELEMLLEAYFSQIEGTLNKLTTLREYIDDTEDYINIQIDNRRNQLIQLELFLNSGMLAMSIYSLVTAIFGMNIPYTWNQDYGYTFKWVIIVAGLSSLALFVTLISYARFKGLVGS